MRARILLISYTCSKQYVNVKFKMYLQKLNFTSR